MDDIYYQVQQWMDFNNEINEELKNIKSDDEMHNRFYKELSFGTGGMRGLIGAGTNRMNEATIKRVTYALGKWLLKTNKQPKVIIAYDTRHLSQKFADFTADILSSMNIEAYVFNEIMATPILSYAVRTFSCDAGVVITASHNPKEYNGYKVYNNKGNQLVPDEAKSISREFNQINDYKQLLKAKRNNKRIYQVDSQQVIAAFLETIPKYDTAQKTLTITYSSLHGTGLKPIQQLLEPFNLNIVEEQATFDGDFPTVRTPNPEDPSALTLAIELARDQKSDVVIATDPDCDRIGIAVKHQEDYISLTGNQIGTLFADYLTTINDAKGKLLLKTIVTNDLGAKIAESRGATVRNTLTGFKYIGEIMNQLEDNNQLDRFLLGYEESYGYLYITSVRDKDAISSTWLVSRLVQYYKSKNMTLIDRLEELYKEFGYYVDYLDAIELAGANGAQQIQKIMTNSRKLGLDISVKAVNMLDYNNAIEGLPAADVLKFYLDDGSWFAMRPSGTEPKMKIYYSVCGDNKEEAKLNLYKLRTELEVSLGISILQP